MKEPLQPLTAALAAQQWALDLLHGVAAALEDGVTLISSTTLHDEPVLRICAINPRTTTADLETSIARLAELAGRAPRA